MRPIKALLCALTTSACLSACVGGDPQASLPAGGVAFTALSTPVPTPQQSVSAAMPGDLLFDSNATQRGGIDPVAILTHRPTRMTAQAAPSYSRAAQHDATPKPSLQGLSTFSAGPGTDVAARTASADDSVTAPMRTTLAKPALTPLGDVEARALAEQRAQDIRDKRFDRQVRHASSIVCSGCVTSPGRRSRVPAQDEPVGE